MYEGTNEVQAADLVLRKLGGKTGEFADRLFAAWQQELAARNDEQVSAAADEALQLLLSATQWIRDKRENDEADARGAATGYLRLFALTALAVFWSRSIAALDGDNSHFAETKRKVGLFYVDQVLPETASIYRSLTDSSSALANISPRDFEA